MAVLAEYPAISPTRVGRALSACGRDASCQLPRLPRTTPGPLRNHPDMQQQHQRHEPFASDSTSRRSSSVVEEACAAHGERYLERIFTRREIADCRTAAGVDPARLAEGSRPRRRRSRSCRPPTRASTSGRSSCGDASRPGGSISNCTGVRPSLPRSPASLGLAVSLTSDDGLAAAVGRRRDRTRPSREPRASLLADLQRPVRDLDQDPAVLDHDRVDRERLLGRWVERLAVRSGRSATGAARTSACRWSGSPCRARSTRASRCPAPR